MDKIDREIAFTDEWYSKNKGLPTYADAIEWADRTMIEKVCKWLSLNMTDTVYMGCHGQAVLSKEELIQGLKTSMKI